MIKKTKYDYYTDMSNKLRRDIKLMIKKDYGRYIEDVECSTRTNPCKFWSYINLKKNSSRISGRMNYRDHELLSSAHIVNGFAKHFGNVYISSWISDVKYV